MATSYGLFNAKNLDRVYTAEDFNKYLSGLICNGVFDTYGERFKVTANGDLTVAIGTGKAWIDGHYFMNDTPLVIDLSDHVREAAITCVLIGISCDTAENARLCKFEISAAAGIGTEVHPVFSDTETKKHLTLAEIRLSAGATSISQSNITDYRDNTSKCGYVKCILGKCKVSEILSKLDSYNRTVTELNERVKELRDRLTEVEEVTGATGIVLASAGKCGLTAYYALYSDGSMKITGTGAINKDAFMERHEITDVLIADGITEIAERAFARAEYASETSRTYGVKKINIPNSVKTIGPYAFMHTRLTEINVPTSVETVGDYAFSDCSKLQIAKIESSLMGNFMFTWCSNLISLTISKNCKKFGQNMLSYCDSLFSITYEGTVSQWKSITKPTNWICSAENNWNGHLILIRCTDGQFEYDSANHVWNEVKS